MMTMERSAVKLSLIRAPPDPSLTKLTYKKSTMRLPGMKFRESRRQRERSLRLCVCLSLILTISFPYAQAFSTRISFPSHASDRQSTLLRSQATSTEAVDLRFSDFAKDHHDATAPPVLLLHGLLGSRRNFATIGNSLASQLEQKRRIVGLDLRNHGENHHDWRDEMHYQHMAADVLAFLDGQQIDKAVIVGHSMGGKVAQALALTQPHRVDGLVVIDIAPVQYTKDEVQWKAVQDIVELLYSIPVEPGITKKQVDEQLRPAVPDPALRAFLLTNLDLKAGQWKIYMEGIVNQLDQIAGFDIDPSHTYEGDTFFIHGGQSRFVRHAYIDSIKSYFPNHMLTTIRGVGHWVHAEAPDDTIALLKRFLDR